MANPHLLLLAVSILTAFSSYADTPKKIGVSVPLTGEAAVFGEDIRDVLRFAQTHYGDTNIEFDFQDDQCTGTGGVTAAHYFVRKKVDAVIGYACVESVMPAKKVLAAAGVPVISLLASGAQIADSGEGVFNLYPSDEVGVRVLISRMEDLQVRHVLVLTASSAFSVGITKTFRHQLPRTVEARFVEYPPLTSDFGPFLVKGLFGTHASDIFINYSSVSEFISFLRLRHQLKHRGRVFTSYLNGFDAVKKAGIMNLAEGVEFYDTPPIEASLREEDRAIFAKYTAVNGHLKSSDGYFPFIFNGYAALRTAFRKSSPLAAALRELKVQGVGRPTSFDETGASTSSEFVLQKVVSGNRVLIR